MDVKAIVLVGAPASADATSDAVTGNVPLAAVDVLGAPLVSRVAERLVAYGASSVFVVGDSGPRPLVSMCGGLPSEVTCVTAPCATIWRACEGVFVDAVQDGAEVLLVMRLGPYLELDFDDLIQFHLDQRNRVTAVCDPEGAPLHTFAISASRRNDAAYLFRHQLEQFRSECQGYVFRGYSNLLQNAGDLRRLTQAAFHGEASFVKPVGRQLKPGVWAGEGARIARNARVLAPAYVGRYAKVRAKAVVTRGSALEHHAEADCGTVIEDSNILPFTRVGAGLDLTHAVVGSRHVFNIPREVEVEITDPALVSAASAHAPLRALTTMAALVTFLPRQIVRGMLPKQQAAPETLTAAVHAPSPALKAPKAREAAESARNEFPTNLIVARRYGNE